MSLNGNRNERWQAAEAHFRQMANRYVIPAIAYAQQMAARPWYSADKVATILATIRVMEAVRSLYTGALRRSMEGQLAEASKSFQESMTRLDALDK